MEPLEVPQSSSGRHKYLIGLFVLTIVVFWINKFLLRGSDDVWARNILSIPVGFLVTLGIGYVFNLMSRKPVELQNASKYGFYTYLIIVLIIPLIMVLNMLGHELL